MKTSDAIVCGLITADKRGLRKKKKWLLFGESIDLNWEDVRGWEVMQNIPSPGADSWLILRTVSSYFLIRFSDTGGRFFALVNYIYRVLPEKETPPVWGTSSRWLTRPAQIIRRGFVGAVYNHMIDIADSASTVTAGMTALFDFCSRLSPDSTWEDLRHLDFEADLLLLQKWLETMLRDDPPGPQTQSFWFGLYHQQDLFEDFDSLDGVDPVLFEICFAKSDRKLITRPENREAYSSWWGDSMQQEQNHYKSPVLKAMRQPIENGPRVGSNDILLMDFALCLGYAYLVIPVIVRSLHTPLLLGHSEEISVVVGFYDDEGVLLGHVRKSGWVPVSLQPRPMIEEHLHVVMAVENVGLRNELLSAITPLNCAPEIVMPETLLQTDFVGDNLIFLETNNDIDRLVSTARQVWAKWSESTTANLRFFTYSTDDLILDSLVLDLWSIGSEMSVIVQTWSSHAITETQRNAHLFTLRLLEQYARVDA